jgi:hypothetical protein
VNIRSPQIMAAMNLATKTAIDSLLLEIRNDVQLILRQKENEGPPYLNPSRPGEPPAARNLAAGLNASAAVKKADIKDDRIVGRVGVNKEYAAPLEFGAPANGLEPRPFLRPTITSPANYKRYAKNAAADFADALRRVFA